MNSSAYGTKYEKFLDTTTNQYMYKTDEIGYAKKNFKNEISMSTFTNVIETVSKMNADLANDLRMSQKNINHLINLLVEINDTGKNELVKNISMDIRNRIAFIYDNLCNNINQQRTENLKLELELAEATNEKNEIRYQVGVLSEEVRKLEESLGTVTDPGFDTMMKLTKKAETKK